uniref:Uncharacterized protein n=1 Tax=Magallana gigas TaxID=29159 RepID=K1QTD4_MAGGI
MAAESGVQALRKVQDGPSKSSLVSVLDLLMMVPDIIVSLDGMPDPTKSTSPRFRGSLASLGQWGRPQLVAKQPSKLVLTCPPTARGPPGGSLQHGGRLTDLPRSHLVGPYSQVGAICLQKEPISGYTFDHLDLLLGKKQSNTLTPKKTTRPGERV